MLVGHRNVAKAVPRQTPLLLTKSKTPRRTIPLVTPLGKLLHWHTTLLVNNFFPKVQTEPAKLHLGAVASYCTICQYQEEFGFTICAIDVQATVGSY